jgi:hypothetical protein
VGRAEAEERLLDLLAAAAAQAGAEPPDDRLGVDLVAHAHGDGVAAEVAHLTLAASKERDELVGERRIVKPQSHHGRFPIDLH